MILGIKEKILNRWIKEGVEMELPRNKDGNYIDLAANIICNGCKTTRRKG